VAGLLVTIAAVSCAWFVGRRMAPLDLALNKPTQVSSVWTSGFDPAAHVLLGGDTRLLFHTEEEDDPWFLIDLGRPMRIGSVEVVNRGDCCPDRAIPLVVEARLEDEPYVEVARRTEGFGTWLATFTPREARWVKLHVPRRTVFHLVRVSIYPP
jgi:hypothetical protein